MIIDVITIFPDFFEKFLTTSIINRAILNNKIKINIHNLRDYSKLKNQQIDDTPYGGGSGMVMMFPPIYKAIKNLKKKDSKVIFLSPQGKILNQKVAQEFIEFQHLILICGHYEGIDERILNFVDFEISIGDYVLTGGEIPAMVLIDAITRLVPGVIKEESFKNDSLYDNRLKYPQYTKPEKFNNLEIPKVLLSGNHEKILEYRKLTSIVSTISKRPDLIVKNPLNQVEKKILKKINL